MKKAIVFICSIILSVFITSAEDKRPSITIECAEEGTMTDPAIDENVWFYDHVFLKGRFNADDLNLISHSMDGRQIKVLNCKDAWFVKSGDESPWTNVTSIIEDGTFPRNLQINCETLVMPRSLKKIIPWQYVNTYNIILPDGIERIEQYAFEWERIVTINLPQTLTYIGSGAFYSSDIKTLRLPDNLKVIEDTCCCGITDKIHLPANLTELSWHGIVFYGPTLTLPASLTRIAPEGLMAPKLEELHSLAQNPPLCDLTLKHTDLQGFSVRDDMIFSCCLMDVDKSKCVLYVPKGCVERYRSAPEWCDFADIREEADGYAEDMTGYDEWNNVEYEYSDIASTIVIEQDKNNTTPRYFDLSGREYANPVKGVNIVLSSGEVRKEIHN